MTLPVVAPPGSRRPRLRRKARDGRERMRELPAAGVEQPWRQRAAAYGTDLFFKFTNDCTMNLVGMVAFSVLTSFVPLILAVVLVLALLPGAHDVHGLAAEINRVLPAGVRKDANVAGFLNSVHGASGLLLPLTITGLLWGGTNLFGAIEAAFAFIYRVKTRDFLPQKLMALLLILLFVVLLPLSFLSSLLLGAATTSVGRVLPAGLHGPLGAVLGLATGLFSLFLLCVAIYTIVPNMPVAWRHAWRGAMVAAPIMWMINTVFPFYAAHFIGTREYGAATISTVIVTISWVWFFSLALLLGAQVNAVGMGLAPWRYDITRVLMEQEGPLRESTRLRRRRGAHRPLPFSGLIRDSHKVRPETPWRPAVREGGTAAGTVDSADRSHPDASGPSVG